MEKVIAETGFDGSVRGVPAVPAHRPEVLCAKRGRAPDARRLDRQARRRRHAALFRKLPRLPYGVRPVPDSMAPNYTTGRYWPGDLEAGVAGGYMVNTYALDQRPLYELAALTVHEAVPGHHHQIALAEELEDMPDFRRRNYITAFGEGWGLYTEFLAIDMGLYDTPYDHFGRLTFEMWRACRLVVDTGLHWYRLERRAGRGLPAGELGARATQRAHRGGALRFLARPGAGLQDRRTAHPRAARRRRGRAGRALRPARLPRPPAPAGAMPLSALEARMRAWIDKIDSSLLEVTLIEADARILPKVEKPEISQSVARELGRIGVQVMTNTRVVEVTDLGITFRGGYFIAADMVIWSAGIRGADFLRDIGGLETNHLNQLVVRTTGQVTRDESIFAIGDCSACPQADGSWVPPRGQAARQLGHLVADNIMAMMQGRLPPKHYVYRDLGSLVNLSKFHTVGNLFSFLGGGVMVEGRIARLTYLSLYRRHLIELYGPVRGVLMILLKGLNRLIRPHLKLH
jgi:hypothetical protein